MDIIYGIVVQNKNGGQVLDTFKKEDSARGRAKEIIEHLQKNKVKGSKVYLTELEYDKKRNVITSEKLVKKNSELLHKT